MHAKTAEQYAFIGQKRPILSNLCKTLFALLMFRFQFILVIISVTSEKEKNALRIIGNKSEMGREDEINQHENEDGRESEEDGGQAKR